MNLIKLLSLCLIVYDAPRQLGNYLKTTTRENVYNLRDLISRQLNWKLTEHLIYRTYKTLNFETENKWDVSSSRPGVTCITKSRLDH